MKGIIVSENTRWALVKGFFLFSFELHALEVGNFSAANALDVVCDVGSDLTKICTNTVKQ